jgi:hypothetical protein
MEEKKILDLVETECIRLCPGGAEGKGRGYFQRE